MMSRGWIVGLAYCLSNNRQNEVAENLGTKALISAFYSG